MRKHNKLLMIILVLIYTLAIPLNAFADSGVISGGVVNIRSGPGTQYDVVGTLLKDTQVDVLSSQNGWHQIQYSNLKGWVVAEYLNVKQSPKLQVTGDLVNLRSGPGTNYPQVGQVKKGEILSLLDVHSQWYQIRTASGVQAYISANYVQSVNPGTSTPAPSNPVPSKPVAPTKPGKAPIVIYNGQQLNFDVPPTVENNRTLVPMRAIFEAMGATVTWDQNKQSATAVKGNKTVVLPLNSTTPTINGVATKIDVPAKVVNQRILAPLRFVGETFGGTVGWNQAAYTITIQLKEEPTPPPIETPKVSEIIVDSDKVNLRNGPGTGYETVGQAAAGESYKVISSRDGWYEISRGGSRAWIASWLVKDANAKPPVQPEQPDPNQPPVVQPDHDTVTLASTRDASGVRLIMQGSVPLTADRDEQRGSITMDIKDIQVEGVSTLNVDLGGQTMQVTGTNQGDNAHIQIRLPENIDYELREEDSGKRIVMNIPNFITGVEKVSLSPSTEKVIIRTLLPLTYGNSNTDYQFDIRINGAKPGRAQSEYRMGSSVVDRVTVSASGQDSVVSIMTAVPAKFASISTNGNKEIHVLMVNKAAIPARNNLVVIDPGHGGSETGSISAGLQEKEVNLDIALRAGNILRDRGIPVEFTRTSDVYVGLEDRARIANMLNAAVFVSVHNNSVTSPTASGTETWYYAPLERPELFIMRSERQELAKAIQDQLTARLMRTNRGVKEGNLSVLRNTQMPSALAEVMFLSNPEERGMLLEDYYRQQAAEAIADGIQNYMQR